MAVQGTDMVGSCTVSVEIGSALDVGNINLVNKVLELREGGGGTNVASHVINGMHTIASSYESNITK